MKTGSLYQVEENEKAKTSVHFMYSSCSKHRAAFAFSFSPTVLETNWCAVVVIRGDKLEMCIPIHSNVSYPDAGDTGTPLYRAAPTRGKLGQSHHFVW